MDVVAAQTDTEVFKIFQPTLEAFGPLLHAHKAEIDAISRKTFKFGVSDRHQLDVYYPPTSASKPPVFHFVYGGAFVQGDRTSPDGLVYNNLGAFFAARGILTVISDYRLVPHVTYPGPATDIRDAIAWVVENVSEADTDRYFLLGHSAGGVHVATALLHPHILSSQLLAKLKSVLLLGTPLDFKYPGTDMDPMLLQYYGSETAIKESSALALLNALPDSKVSEFPVLRTLICEKDPPGIKATQPKFIETLKAKGGKIEEVLVKKHNHVSLNLALNSGQKDGEVWAEELADWIKSQ